MSVGLFTDPVYDAALSELADLQVEKARAYAVEMRLLASLAVRTSREGWQAEAPRDSLILDVAGTCQVGQLAASSRLDDAEHLVVRLPGTLALLEAGELLVPQATVLISETKSCSPAVCAEVEARVLPTAAGRAPARLRDRVRKAVLAVDAEHAARRAAAARADRRVWMRPADDGMAMVFALAPASDAARLMVALTARARDLLAAGDPRTIDQLRTDLLCGWTVDRDAEQPDHRRRSRAVQVVVHVPVATALGLSDEPGRLEGYGPLDAPSTRRLIAEAELRKVCTDSRTGRVAAEDAVVRPARGDHDAIRETLIDMVLTDTVTDERPEPQHDPSAPLARLVRLRDQGCDGLGCGVGVEQCELDHHDPWPAGPTSATNLRARSPRCHHAKHRGWTVTLLRDGSTQWTNPGGRSYLVPSRDEPPPPLEPHTELPTPEQLRARDTELTRADNGTPAVVDEDDPPDW